MSLVRFLPAWFHAIADYAVGITLIAVALIVGGTGVTVATGVVVSAVVLVVSMLPDSAEGLALLFIVFSMIAAIVALIVIHARFRRITR